MKWKIGVLNRLTTSVRDALQTVDTGSPETSINIDSPTAGTNEIKITTTPNLTEDDQDQLTATLDTLTHTYDLNCEETQLSNNTYQYTLGNPDD